MSTGTEAGKNTNNLEETTHYLLPLSSQNKVAALLCTRILTTAFCLNSEDTDVTSSNFLAPLCIYSTPAEAMGLMFISYTHIAICVGAQV